MRKAVQNFGKKPKQGKFAGRPENKKSKSSDGWAKKETSAPKSGGRKPKFDGEKAKSYEKPYTKRVKKFDDKDKTIKPIKTGDFKPDKKSGESGLTKKTAVKKTGSKGKVQKSIDLANKAVRLNKYIADSGLTSRRKADELIAAGKVKINRAVVTELGAKVQKGDRVTVNGDPIDADSMHLKYIILNKPKDYLTTTSDELHRKTVMDLVKSRERIYPVGRLDRNTTGLLLLTNDGELANRLTHPKYKIERIYNAGLDKNLKIEDAKKIAEGVELEDGMTAPCNVFLHPEDYTKVTLTLTEGRNREVRRLFEHFGYTVKKLDRKYFANLSTTGLKRGEFRPLTLKEIRELKSALGMQ